MIRVFLSNGGYQDFDADSFSLGKENDGRSLIGCLRLWKVDPTHAKAPEVVVLFAPHAWLTMVDLQGPLREERTEMGFQPPARFDG